MLKRRIIVWTLVAAALVAAIAWSLRTPAVDVEIATAQHGTLEVTLDQEGRTYIEDRFVVSAPVAGIARRVELEAGDPVEAGQSLVVLEPLATESLDPRSSAEARADLEQAEAAARAAVARLEAARAEADRARQRDDRLRRAAAGGAISRDDLDAAEADLRAAEAAWRAAAYQAELSRAAVEAARARLAIGGGTRAEEPTVTVRAPVSACVLRVEHESEGVVRPGEPLIELGCPASLEVRADVLSADAVELEVGGPARVEEWGREEPLAARIVRIEPQAFTKVSALGVEEQRVWVVLELLDPMERWAALGDAYRVMVRFVLWRGDDVLQVPAAAVFDVDGAPHVFLIDADDRLEIRAIEAGHRSPRDVEVLTGLEEGDEVVAHPRRELSAGQRIRRSAPSG